MRGTAGSGVFLFSMTIRRLVVLLVLGLAFADLSGCAGDQWRNRERDSSDDAAVVSDGWSVLRFWECVVRERREVVVDTITVALTDMKT